MVAALQGLLGVGCTYNYYQNEGGGGEGGEDEMRPGSSSASSSSSSSASSSSSSSSSGGTGEPTGCFPVSWINGVAGEVAPCGSNGGALWICFDGPGGTLDPRTPPPPANCYGTPWMGSVSIEHASQSCCSP